jgi:hypothetical protein
MIEKNNINIKQNLNINIFFPGYKAQISGKTPNASSHFEDGTQDKPEHLQGTRPVNNKV